MTDVLGVHFLSGHASVIYTRVECMVHTEHGEKVSDI